MNELVKFELKAKHTYFFIVIFYGKKDRYVSHIRFTFHSKNPQIKYTMKSLEKKKREGATNKFERVHDFF